MGFGGNFGESKEEELLNRADSLSQLSWGLGSLSKWPACVPVSPNCSSPALLFILIKLAVKQQAGSRYW